MDKDERMAIARQGRDTAKAIAAAKGPPAVMNIGEQGVPAQENLDDLAAIPPPPGQDDVRYESLAGN